MSIYLIEIKFSFSNGTMSHTIEPKQLKEFKPYRLVQALHLRKSVSQFVRGFQSPPLGPSCPLSLFKIFISPPLFSVPPHFKVFQTVPPTLTQPPPALIQHTNLPYTLTHN